MKEGKARRAYFFFIFYKIFNWPCCVGSLHRVRSFLRLTGSVVALRGLSCSMACGILFPNQGSKLCPLPCKVDD